jgi:hypothetical protein
MAIGNIIMVVAVLLIHILIKPVASMNPSIILFPLVPVNFTILSAIRLWRFHFSIANPIMNPPIKRNTTSLAYGAVVSFILAILNRGNNTIGKSATTGMGNASVIHQVIINEATDITLRAFSSNWKGLKAHMTNASIKPVAIPIY